MSIDRNPDLQMSTNEYKEPKFYNKDGSLTKFSLQCGYIEKKGHAQLYREHECYHIQAWINVEGAPDKHVRESTWSLTEARVILRKLSKVAIDVYKDQPNRFALP